jgi:hypothetical protein
MQNKTKHLACSLIFSKGFWDKHAEKLDSFTSGKTGIDYVKGVVERGRWLKDNHPIRSARLNIIDFFQGIKYTISSGPDPASRQIIKTIIKE